MSQFAIDKVEKSASLVGRTAFTKSLPQRPRPWRRMLRNGMLDSLPLAAAMLDENLILQEQNRTYRQYLDKYSPMTSAGALGRCFFDYFPGSSHWTEASIRYIRDSRGALAEKEKEIGLVYETGGRKTFWNANLVALVDRDDRLAGMLIFCLDVSPSKLAAIELEEWPNRLAMLSQELEDAKTTIRFLSDLRLEDKLNLERNVHLNSTSQVIPLLEALKHTRLNKKQRDLVESIEAVLPGVTDRMTARLSAPPYSMTAKEMAIIGMIKAGKTTKEIAAMLNVSTAAIDFHRNNIRKKLGLNNRATNLRAHLLALS